jgi:small-conductance mechanosensitive channel
VQPFSPLHSREWVTLAALLIAFVVWRLFDAAITRFYARRFLSRFIPRVSTYVGVTKSIVGLIIFFALVLEILNIWEVNVTPALWSAGVLGVVIGVGAQAIVRDVLTGAFYLFEDTFDVGDGVELTTGNGVIHGVVEAISLREVRLVDDRGYVVSVPYGSIVYAANATRLPLRLSMDFVVPLRDDVASLREQFTKIAQNAVQKSNAEVDGLAVMLTDVSPAGATFRVHFQAKRKEAHMVTSALRELITADLQAQGFFPKSEQANAEALPTQR